MINNDTRLRDPISGNLNLSLDLKFKMHRHPLDLLLHLAALVGGLWVPELLQSARTVYKIEFYSFDIIKQSFS